jgi:hypothetical protein
MDVRPTRQFADSPAQRRSRAPQLLPANHFSDLCFPAS